MKNLVIGIAIGLMCLAGCDDDGQEVHNQTMNALWNDCANDIRDLRNEFEYRDSELEDDVQSARSIIEEHFFTNTKRPIALEKVHGEVLRGFMLRLDELEQPEALVLEVYDPNAPEFKYLA
ncbi:hypothetical protein KAR91_81390, partial [Candidatus Pacearchaeota archaeon]|nr:hypothetical protein [Candidatus Pacearchaeota archaeon]